MRVFTVESSARLHASLDQPGEFFIALMLGLFYPETARTLIDIAAKESDEKSYLELQSALLHDFIPRFTEEVEDDDRGA